ncbi:MAG: type II toxin-antitoxin system VapC family toxin [Bryobacteraceae bacterium]
MRLLLDTHIWLWSLSDFDRLTRRVARALEDDKNELWLSPISMWELVILSKKGRITLEDGVNAWVAKAMKRIPLNEAPITHEVALETQRIPLTTRIRLTDFLPPLRRSLTSPW